MAKTTTFNVNSAKRFTVYERYNGGINLSDDETKIDEIELGGLTKNVVLTPKGTISRRYGLTRFDSYSYTYVNGFFKPLLTDSYGNKCLKMFPFMYMNDRKSILRIVEGRVRRHFSTPTNFYDETLPETKVFAELVYEHEQNVNGEMKETKVIRTITNSFGILQEFVPPINFVEDMSNNAFYIIDSNNVYLFKKDSETLEALTPRKISPFEAKTYGYNMLSDDPINHIGYEANTFTTIVWGVNADTMELAINDDVTFTCYASSPSDVTLYYKFEYKLRNKDGSYITENWETLKLDEDTYTDDGFSLNNKRTYKIMSNQDIELRVTVRNADTIGIADHKDIHVALAFFNVLEGREKDANPDSLIKKCTKGFLYNNRLWLYGNANFPHMLFYSEINDYTYFPTYNYFLLSNTQGNPILTHSFFQDKVVMFLKNGLKTISGYDISDFKIKTINESINIAHEQSCINIQDYVVFAGNDGIWFLYNDKLSIDSNANLVKIDEKIEKNIEHNSIREMFTKGDYVYFNTTSNIVWKYNIKYRIWLKDEYPEPLTNIVMFNNTFYGTYKQGSMIWYYNDNYYTDIHVMPTGEIDGILQANIEYLPNEMVIESKKFSLDALFNVKKMKEIQFLFKYKPDIDYDYLSNGEENPNAFNIDLFVGGRYLSEDNGHSYINENGEWVYSEPSVNGYDIKLPNTFRFDYDNVLGTHDEAGIFNPDDKIIKRFRIPSVKSNDVKFVIKTKGGMFELLAHGIVYQVKKANSVRITRL